MMPVSEIMSKEIRVQVPPILVIDETTIKCTVDAGPVCGCYEKYFAVQSYKPFVPGGTNPYKKKKPLPQDLKELKIYWQKTTIANAAGGNFNKPFAVHPCELSENFVPPKDEKPKHELFLRLPRYTEGYFKEKLLECKREHVPHCDCPVR